MAVNTLIVETSGNCNLRCTMCPRRYFTPPKILMDDKVFEEVLRIVEANSTLKIVDLTGWNEPLLDPKLEEKIKRIKKVNENLRVGFTTNGSLMDEERAEKLLKSGVDWICVSFDGGTKKVYESVRINSNYEKVLSNLKRLSHLRRELCVPVNLSAVMVVMKTNFSEMEEFARLFYELGFDAIVYKPMDVICDKKQLKFWIDREKIFRKFEEIKKKYEGKIYVGEWDLSPNLPKNDCLARAASGAIFISVAGDVSPCCNLGHDVPRIVKSRFLTRKIESIYFSLGNILHNSFDDILNRYEQEFVRKFREGILPKPCKGCMLTSAR